MKNAEIGDPLFLGAVEAIDAGNIATLESLLEKYPRLVHDRLNYPTEGYFKNPFLLWFIAGNPIRVGKLPSNIVQVTRSIINVLKREADASVQEQLDYTLGLVATGRVPRESGLQLEMIDLLIDEGAKPGGGLDALAHGNIGAAERLIERGGKLTLAAAVALDRMADVISFAVSASQDEQLVALTAAAFYGKPRMISYLLGIGVSPNGYPKSDSGFHTHATPLHQAVCSGSLDAVKLLVEAGAKLDARDQAYNGTPLNWAEYMPTEEGCDETAKKNFKRIADYLRGKGTGKVSAQIIIEP